VSEGWVNPYQVTKRGADTLNVVMEKRLQFRLRRVFGDNHAGFTLTREWRTVGGSVGSWHSALIEHANRFLDAGMIDYLRPAGISVDQWSPQVNDWSPVQVTEAGLFLFRAWQREPFVVVPTSEVPERIERAAVTLSTAYVENSGLLEDARDRYATALRPHAERVVAELLDVENVGGVWR
jgi:hypothetical protein